MFCFCSVPQASNVHLDDSDDLEMVVSCVQMVGPVAKKMMPLLVWHVGWGKRHRMETEVPFAVRATSALMEVTRDFAKIVRLDGIQIHAELPYAKIAQSQRTLPPLPQPHKHNASLVIRIERRW